MNKKNKIKWNWILGFITFVTIIISSIFLVKKICIPFFIGWLMTLEGIFFLYVINETDEWTLSDILVGKWVSLIMSGGIICAIGGIGWLGKTALTKMTELTKEQMIVGITTVLIILGICGLIIGYFYFNYKIANKIGKKKR